MKTKCYILYTKYNGNYNLFKLNLAIRNFRQELNS